MPSTLFRHLLRILLPVLASLTGAQAAPLSTAPDISPQQIQGATRINAEALLDLIATRPELLVIDARIEADRRNGFIEGSVSLPNTRTDCESLASRLDGRSSPVAFYCNGPKCGRSAKSTRIALDCGYTDVYWFRGGIEEWLDKQYPLAR